MTFNIITLTAFECHYDECLLCWVSQLSPLFWVIIMLSIVMLSAVMLSVIMLSVIMPKFLNTRTTKWD